MNSTHNRNWDTVVCIASGPSLTQEQVDYAIQSDAYTIAVNDNYKLCNPDIVYAADILWWIEHYKNVVETCDSELWTLQHVPRSVCRKVECKRDFNEIPFNRGLGLGTEVLHHGGNSGYHAINLSFLFGAKKIILIGYDHQRTNDKAHWFGDHPKKFPKNASHMNIWLNKFDILANDCKKHNVDLVNCSIETAITSCRRSNLEEEI